MKKFSVLIIAIVFFSCESSKQGILNSDNFHNKCFRLFSFHTQNFSNEIVEISYKRFCYKVYYSKKNDKRVAFEFINEKNKTEFIGYFNADEMLKKISVIDTSRGRMNMEFFYSSENILKSIKLLDDDKKIFAFGKVIRSNEDKVMFIKFNRVETNEPVLFHIIRGNEQGRDLEIATYSTDGTLFSNHLYFYNKNKLSRYEFYKKLNFMLGIQFYKGRISDIYKNKYSSGNINFGEQNGE